MPYLSSLTIAAEKEHPFPYDIPAVRFAKDINLDCSVNFFIGDNGTGKSTLLETIAYRLQLPHIDGSSYRKDSFQAAEKLVPHLQISWNMKRPIGFFFRAEDFGDYLNSVDRTNWKLHGQLDSLHGEVPADVIEEMKRNANYQIHHMRQNYGQELQSFSHGEAYLQIMQEKIKDRGIFLLDEPEAALSPAKQLSLIYFIRQHLSANQSQFIIATHSPILMAYPGANLYEITETGMRPTAVEDTEHYSITKGFLNDPEAYLRHLS
jgi:predicted ATPase